MTVIADSGAIYALYDADDRHHDAVRQAVESNRGPLVVPVAALAEIDYLLREFLGIDAELDFIRSVRQGAFALEPLADGDLSEVETRIERYRALDLGLVDAAVMATADRLRTRRILTVDERDFRAARSADGTPFVLLPADA